MAGVMIFGETKQQMLELIQAGKALAQELGTVLMGFALKEEEAEEYGEYGLEEIFLLPELGETERMESYVPVMAQTAQGKDADVFLLGGMQRAREMGARLASRLNTGICSGCLDFAVNKESQEIEMKRLIYGGLAEQTVVVAGRPQMAVIAPRTFEEVAEKEAGRVQITKLEKGPEERVRVESRTPHAKESVDLSQANIIVCIGRGLEKQEDMILAEELAQVLGGEVGCSRPIAEELKWLPEERYIGISGKCVKPAVYIGLGVSGQIQHVTGIRESKIIVGIDKNENAPIFEASDYGMVGNLYEIVPKLTEALKKELNR